MGRQVSNSFDVLHARTSQPARPDRPLHAAFVQRAKHRYSIHPSRGAQRRASSSDLPSSTPRGERSGAGAELRRPHRQSRLHRHGLPGVRPARFVDLAGPWAFLPTMRPAR